MGVLFADSVIQLQEIRGLLDRPLQFGVGSARSRSGWSSGQAFSPDPGLRGTRSHYVLSERAVDRQASAIRLGAGGEVDVSIVLRHKRGYCEGYMNVR